MPELGSLSLYGVVALAAYALLSSALGALRKREHWIRSAERAVHAAFGLLVLAFALLEWALVADRFDLKFVSKISAVEQPLVFKLAIWGGQEGSLLLWASMLGAMASLVVLQNRNRNRDRHSRAHDYRIDWPRASDTSRHPTPHLRIPRPPVA